MLTAHHDVQILYGGNDDSALGCLLAAQSQGLDPTKMAIIGIDGTADAMTAICKGQMIADAGELYTDKSAEIISLTEQILGGAQNIPLQYPAIVSITQANVQAEATSIGSTLPATCTPYVGP